MNLLIVSSEALPYAQTGGLGDVVSVMTHELAARNHHVKLILPLYRSIDRSLFKLKKSIEMMNVEMGNTTLSCRVWQLDNDEPHDVYFIEYNHYFDRKSLYGDDNEAYLDNGKRFAFFSKAALEVAVQLNFKTDVVHANDWQTAIVSYYLKTWNWENGFFDRTASVLTIHNLGYQGQTDLSASNFIGLNWMQVREEEFESLGTLNLLKGGIFYADQITTVSPTYAKEILTEPGGCGLSQYLSRRANDITGILNGVNTNEWDPASDQMLPATYSRDDLSGKGLCKKELQKVFSLPINESIPIFAFIGRFADQKGLSILKDTLETILTWELQLIILGSGDPFYSDLFGNLPNYYPDKVATYIGFQSKLAHLIEAGADFFIMPSLYEPCGLNQMYSLLYGTPPIVRATGGLVDTVDNYDEKSGRGTGFIFQDITPNALLNTVGWALNTWYNNKESYLAMQYRGMGKDFSWNGSIAEYERVFQLAQKRRAHWQ
jgi:starch synthase